MKRTIINGLIAGLAAGSLVACGGNSDSSSPDSKMLATTAACYTPWVSTTAYNGGATVSYASVNYTAAYWTQNQNPSTNNGPAGSGQPWISNGACGASPTPTPAPTPTPTPAPTPTPTPAPTPTPTPAPTPTSTCTLQAEDYSNAYDDTAGNAGGAYRTGDVDIEATSDTGGGYDVGWIDTGEWLVHNSVTFPTTGSYTFQYRVASINSTGVISSDLNAGSIQLGTTAIPNTGGWQIWTTVQRTVTVNAGTYNVGTYMSTGGFNLNWIKIVGASCGTTPTPTPTPTPAPTPAPTPTSTAVVGGYYPSWVASPVRLRNIDSHYNLIYLFAATAPSGDTSGRVTWTPPSDVNGAWTNWNADIQYARSTQHRKIILSVGGAGHAMSFPNRTVTTTFVDSVDALYSQWGGFDGLDWNTFEGQTPDTSEMIWASQELKRRHPGFIVTAPPAPWNTTDQQFCKDMLNAGAIDYCAPQYYDGPNLADPSWALPNIDTWVNLIGANHLVIGFGVDPNTANYWTISSAVSTWKQIKAKYPTIHGAFDWQINNDLLQGYPFAQQLGPLVP